MRRSGTDPVRAIRAPSSSFIRIWYSSTDLAVDTPPAGLKPIVTPVRSRYSRIMRTITSETSSVALTPSLPVDVLMKSAPAIMQTIDARATFESVRDVAGGENRLDVRRAAGRAEVAHFVVERLPVAGEHMFARDDDIDFRAHRPRPTPRSPSASADAG